MKKPIELQITSDGYKKLEEEFKQLTEKRPGVLIRMVAAREQGDLSENAGYHAAKEELGRIDRRLRELKILLRFADVVDSKQVEAVSFGNTVTVNDGQSDMDFKIVSAIEANPMQGKISDVSPIGRALLGKKKGEQVKIETPGGSISYQIVEIS